MIPAASVRAILARDADRDRAEQRDGSESEHDEDRATAAGTAIEDVGQIDGRRSPGNDRRSEHGSLRCSERRCERRRGSGPRLSDRSNDGRWFVERYGDGGGRDRYCSDCGGRRRNGVCCGGRRRRSVCSERRCQRRRHALNGLRRQGRWSCRSFGSSRRDRGRRSSGGKRGLGSRARGERRLGARAERRFRSAGGHQSLGSGGGDGAQRRWAGPRGTRSCVQSLGGIDTGWGRGGHLAQLRSRIAEIDMTGGAVCSRSEK